MNSRINQISGIVLQLLSSGDRYWRLCLFTADHGLQAALLRKSAKSGAQGQPDLFDDLDCSLSYSSKGGEIGFIKEWRVLSKRSYLGQDHRVFLAASEMALLFLENARHLLEPKPFYDLLLKCLNALQSGHPTVVKIKTLFVFAETEGLPVRQAWLPELSDSLKDQTKLILSTPTSDLVELPDSSHEILKSLSLWLNSETEIKCSIP